MWVFLLAPHCSEKNLKEKHLNMNQDVGTFLAPPCSVPNGK